MNIIGILCITLAINSWGRAMFDLDSFPTWANVTGVWAWLCHRRWSTHTLPSLSTGARQRPLVRATAQDDTVDRMQHLIAARIQSLACFHWHLSLACERKRWWIWLGMEEEWLRNEIKTFFFIYTVSYWSYTSIKLYCQIERHHNCPKQPILQVPFKSTLSLSRKIKEGLFMLLEMFYLVTCSHILIAISHKKHNLAHLLK